MGEPQRAAQAFESLVPAPVTVVHHFVSELHVLAADVACGLAGAHLGKAGLRGARTIHVGAGFGGDTRAACLWGAAESTGIEAGADQVAFDRSIRESSDEELSAEIRGDSVTSRLYPPAAIDFAVTSLLEERRHLKRLPWAASARVKQGDILGGQLLEIAGGAPRDAMVGSIMLHWLMVGGASLADGLDLLAPALKSGGVAVFSVPYHLVQPKDPAEEAPFRSRIAQAAPFYGALVGQLMPRLVKLGANVLATGSSKFAPILVHDADAEAGSRAFELVQIQTRYFAGRNATFVDVLRGTALYESSIRTGLHARDLVEHVADAVDAALNALSPQALAEPVGTFLRFYVFRKRAS